MLHQRTSGCLKTIRRSFPSRRLARRHDVCNADNIGRPNSSALLCSGVSTSCGSADPRAIWAVGGVSGRRTRQGRRRGGRSSLLGRTQHRKQSTSMRTPFVSGRRMDSFERLLKTPIFFRLRRAPKNQNAHSLDGPGCRFSLELIDHHNSA